MHIFDYAGEGGYKIPLIAPKICKVNEVNKLIKQSYVLKFCSAKVEDIDFKALYLGKVRNSLSQENLALAIKNFAEKESGF
jgi:hypothetical protein